MDFSDALYLMMHDGLFSQVVMVVWNDVNGMCPVGAISCDLVQQLCRKRRSARGMLFGHSANREDHLWSFY